MEYTYSQNDWLQPENVRGYLSQPFLAGVATVSFAGTVGNAKGHAATAPDFTDRPA